MEKDPNGEWVKYEDVCKIFDAYEKQVDKLLAELKKYKTAISKIRDAVQKQMAKQTS
jgi:hypothetical protein